jgi:hypothetical protein
MTKLTKAEREELRKIIAEARDVCHCGQYVDEHTVSDNHAALAMDTQESDRLTAASLEAMPRLLADLDAAEAERDQLKQTQCGIMHFVDKWLDELDEVDEPTEDPVSRSMRAREIALKWGEGIAAERDALKAKLADPRRVVIHETEVVATKEEIATLKARLADLSEADEELHTCRALVNATSENLSVDLERMVDDLAEVNEKAARSEKDSHSWHDLYEDAKAKLAALVERAQVVLDRYGLEVEMGVDVPALRKAIAAARGGATQ